MRVFADFMDSIPQDHDGTENLPAIEFGKGHRIICRVLGKPNSKGFVKVRCLPDALDMGTQREFSIRLSTPIAWVHNRLNQDGKALSRIK